jgi:hypothetical protein
MVTAATIYYMPDSILNVYVGHFISILTTLWSSYLYNHFSDEEVKQSKFMLLTSDPIVSNCQNRVQIQSLIPVPRPSYFYMPAKEIQPQIV